MTKSTVSPSVASAVPEADTTSAADCESKLRRVLQLNALNSFVFGGLLAAIPSTIDELLDTGHPGWVRLVGIGLLAFAGFLVWLTRQPFGVLHATTPSVIAGDVSWVVASVITVVLGWYSGGGVAAVLAMAVVVDVFAVLQWSAWRKLRSTR